MMKNGISIILASHLIFRDAKGFMEEKKTDLTPEAVPKLSFCLHLQYRYIYNLADLYTSKSFVQSANRT